MPGLTNKQTPSRSGRSYRLLKYIFRRGLTIALTIALGVFGVVLIANTSGQFDANVRKDIATQVRWRQVHGWLNDLPREQREQIIEEEIQKMEESAGLNLSFWPRHTMWTYRALFLYWGDVSVPVMRDVRSPTFTMGETREVLLERLKNTMLLIGTAYLLIFLVSVPLALSLARRAGSWWDKFISFLVPLSSAPSWVHGVFLMLIFAFELGWLPFSGMYDFYPPDSKWGYLLIVGKHMILPVTAIVISVLFQLAYGWRTFFLIYENEDFVDVAKAKGLPTRMVETRYILRPAMPYVVTSFALTFASFWQMTTALEIIFDWPGVGRLYIDSLPHFWGEGMYPGNMILTVSIVVVFAYLMGLTVLVLDAFYAMVDPRVRLSNEGQTARLATSKKNGFSFFRKEKNILSPTWSETSTKPAKRKFHIPNFKPAFSQFWITIKPVIEEVRHYPTAMIGLALVVGMIILSIHTVITRPYNEVQAAWFGGSLSGQSYVPRLAQPTWVNIFRKSDLPPTMILDSRNGTAQKTYSTDKKDIDITFTFEYPYTEFPQDVSLYFYPTYETKKPYVTVTWITPDNRELNTKGTTVSTWLRIPIGDYLPIKRLVAQNPGWKEWVDVSGAYPTPTHYLLFSDPASSEARAIPGTYTVHINGLTFEEGNNLDVELVILGEVYGMAGTDYRRRDLILPLLWGMPFALIFGLVGASITTTLSMIVAALGVWFGGWVDALIQRIIEANMILPILAVGILIYGYYGVSLWVIIGIIVLLNVFSSPTKAFRAAFLQVKEEPYIESARAYGSSNWRIISKYMVPRIIAVWIPQLVTLIPSFVFLEATLGLFNINVQFPTWGHVIFEGLKFGPTYGSRYWVLEPIALIFLTSIAFSMLGFALERIFNPRLKNI